jgi:hypothetical protein
MLRYTYIGGLVELLFCSTFRAIAPSPNMSSLIEHILFILKIKNGLQDEVIHDMLTIMGFPFLYAKMAVFFPPSAAGTEIPHSLLFYNQYFSIDE